MFGKLFCNGEIIMCFIIVCDDLIKNKFSNKNTLINNLYFQQSRFSNNLTLLRLSILS